MARKAKTAKKAQKEEIQPKPSIPWTTTETRGFLIFAFAIILLLSLMSFAIAPDSKNLLGVMGDKLGWLFHAAFGLSSYMLVIYIGWIGWRLLFSKSLHFMWLKHIYVAICLISTSMLLSLIESDYPTFANFLGSSFYPGLWLKSMRYHLGGAPFFYLYQDMPAFNLNHIFNTAGVALIFSSTLIASLLFLFKIRLLHMCQKIMERFKHEISAKRELTAAEKTAEGAQEEKKENKEQTKKDDKKGSAASSEPDSDFLRFVKLRIPTTHFQETQAKSGLPNTPSDLLAIQPEKNPKIRPSVSRKELSDDVEEEPLGYPPSLSRPKKRETIENLTDDEGREAFKRPENPKDVPGENKARRRENALTAQSIYNGDFTNYNLPSLNLLTNPKNVDQSSLKKDLKRQAEVLEETLLSFGIEAKVGQINCGPTITSFEVHPAIGVKVQKIKTLDNDIALNMEAKSIRIIAPIPGKAAVGIEVPNPQPQEVGFKDMLLAYQQGSQKLNIPILLGKAVNGDYVMSDLAKMPHCIIAGATGSGKSVCINTIVMSIALNAKPDQIKLIMVDPKKVELTPYTRLPHMLAPVITEPQGAAAALNWLVKEMEKRYEILKLVGVRNIDSFNKRTINPEFEATLGREIPASMPFIVGIIDELADLMMVASQDIETPIARIAQMARAVGIHLILATQRPSREVITGLIKANFPTRISFKVASRVNSQIVLDETGAETLLGNGDMLFLPPGSSHLIRAQGAFVRDEDILAVVQHICEQAPPNYVIQSFDQFNAGLGDLSDGVDQDIELDALYEQAKDVVLSTGNASTTFLQRKLKIGYARAASLMDQLEMQGIVGPAEGSRPRKIYAAQASAEESDDLLEQDLLE
ncbi:FtsK/SpoIIIE family protein [Candidatus Protochlamydia naegleriophila]|uniref:FtsK/SpoIIIE family protein n=1 Tax=Candidatus Protochlamydia naegleriophila TaxID=389348 RepID=A0A0U5JC98_9BACT|nr:DNA translocase FtsK [Candidatus Protochlamydia naegleriophila]CUI17496.1 FtsK/SpoIIIE family protein [Candidatus Protochlamydia naegleriophila]